ncbi:MAG: hypothetical protein NPIRA02_01190 [Nitrospirales bacterium]|nr:MAG: hypothetical protein NPIRA02_01190 [Nitrospirales bacterium]
MTINRSSILAILVVLFGSPFVMADDSVTETASVLSLPDSWQAFVPCLKQAAKQYGLPAVLVAAVIDVESGGNPLAIGVNTKTITAPTPKTKEEAVIHAVELWQRGVNFDVGLGQINRQNIKEHRIDLEGLFDPCVNVQWVSYFLYDRFQKYGLKWTAVERYNGVNPEYSWKVYDALQRMRRMREFK